MSFYKIVYKWVFYNFSLSTIIKTKYFSYIKYSKKSGNANVKAALRNKLIYLVKTEMMKKLLWLINF